MDEQPALTTGGDRHVAAKQKRKPAEHLLFGEIPLIGNELAYALRELLVVRHDADRTR